jgi:hypothetical protein
MKSAMARIFFLKRLEKIFSSISQGQKGIFDGLKTIADPF